MDSTDIVVGLGVAITTAGLFFITPALAITFAGLLLFGFSLIAGWNRP